jgi:hypothetical protein
MTNEELKEFLDWLRCEPDFNISKYDVDEIIQDWNLYKSDWWKPENLEKDGDS